MEKGDVTRSEVESKPFHVRKLTKSGNSRYLSVGAFLPLHWINVKVVIEELSGDSCLLRLEPIR